MEQADDKNYVKMMDSSDKPKKHDHDGGKVTIHTMPKRYMASMPASSHAKSTGILILVLGFLFLIVALMLLYFYVLKKEPIVEPLQVEKPIIEKPIEDSGTVEDPKNNNNNQTINIPGEIPEKGKSLCR